MESLNLKDLPNGFHDLVKMPCRALDLFVEDTHPSWTPFKSYKELHTQSDGVNTDKDESFRDGRLVGPICSLAMIVVKSDRRICGLVSARLCTGRGLDSCWWLENLCLKNVIKMKSVMDMFFSVATELGANNLYMIIDPSSGYDPR